MLSSSRLMVVVAAFLLATITSTWAQVTRSSSIDPLNGSTFSTPYYTPPVTYTFTTTYPIASPTTTAVIEGVGPSVATSSYTFSYGAPESSLTGIFQSSLFSSLAANGMPTQYTSAFEPSTKDLQIVDAAVSHMHVNHVAFFYLASMAVACVLGALWIL